MGGGLGLGGEVGLGVGLSEKRKSPLEFLIDFLGQVFPMCLESLSQFTFLND